MQVPIPPAFGGVNDATPLIALQSPNAQYLMNFNIKQEGLVLRNGDTKFASLSMAAAGTTPTELATYGESYLFAVGYNLTTAQFDIYNVETGAVVHSFAGTAGETFYPVYFNQYLFIYGPLNASLGVYFDGAAFGAVGYSGSSLSPIGGTVFKGRQYIIQQGEAAYWYTKPLQVTGAVTKIDLSSIIEESSDLIIISPVTLSDNVSSVELLAFVFLSGEVIFYSGSYPNSANWGIAGRGYIGPPLWYNLYLSYKGDAIVPCENGVFSLRDLFLKNTGLQESFLLDERIRRTWLDLCRLIRVYNGSTSGLMGLNVRIVWDKVRNRILISFPWEFDVVAGDFASNSAPAAVSVGNFIFVYDTILHAWSFHTSRSTKTGSTTKALIDLVYYKNKVLGMAAGTTKIMVFEKEGSTGFVDRDAEDSANNTYPYKYISAPASLKTGKIAKCNGLDFIWHTDLSANTYFTVNRNFRPGLTTAQLINQESIQIENPFLNVGIEGSFFQYQVTGVTAASKTVGLKFYNANFWLEEGGSPR